MGFLGFFKGYKNVTLGTSCLIRPYDEINGTVYQLEFVSQKSCSEKFRKIQRKKPVLGSLFNKITGLQARNFMQKILQHSCFPVKFGKFLRTPFFYRTPKYDNCKNCLADELPRTIP